MGEMVLLKDLADKVTDSKDDIILAKVNGKLQELTKTVDSDSLIEFVTTAEPAGNLTYKRSATLILLKAVYDIIDKDMIEKFKVEFSLSKGYYCTLKGKQKLTVPLIEAIENRMREIVRADIPIEKNYNEYRRCDKIFCKA